MELSLQHEFYFSNKEPITISQLVESLQAYERIVKRSIPVVQALYPGTTIYSVNVYLPEIRKGSAIVNAVIRFFWGTQEGLNDSIDNARAGAIELMKNRPVIAAVVAVVVAGGVAYATYRWVSSDSQKVTVNAYNSIVLQQGSQIIGVSPEELKRILESRIPDHNKNSNDAVRFLRPARSERGSFVQFNYGGGVDALELPEQVIRALPDAEVEEDAEFLDFAQTTVDIRVIDLDKPNGWSARIPASGSNKRIKLRVSIDVDLKYIRENNDIIGDVTVLYKMGKNEKRFPAEALLRRVYTHQFTPAELP